MEAHDSDDTPQFLVGLNEKCVSDLMDGSLILERCQHQRLEM